MKKIITSRTNTDLNKWKRKAGHAVSRKFKDLSIAAKLAIGFGSLVLTVVGLSLLSYTGLQNLVEGSKRASESDRLKNVAAEIEIAHLMWVGRVRDVFTDESIRKLEVQLDPTQCSLGKWLSSPGRLAAETSIPLLKDVFAEIEEPHRRLHGSAVRINEFLQAGDNPTKRTNIEEVYKSQAQPSFQQVQKLLIRTRELAQAHTEKEHTASRSVETRTGRLVLLITLAGIAAALTLCVLISRSIAVPLKQVVSRFKQAAGGDLTVRLDVSSNDEIGQMGASLNGFLSQLEGSVRLIGVNAQNLAGAAQQLSAASEQLSARSARAGLFVGRDRSIVGTDHRHRQAECGQCQAGQPTGSGLEGHRRERR
jgi:methyl-accepting chemotaxis protein